MTRTADLSVALFCLIMLVFVTVLYKRNSLDKIKTFHFIIGALIVIVGTNLFYSKEVSYAGSIILQIIILVGVVIWTIQLNQKNKKVALTFLTVALAEQILGYGLNIDFFKIIVISGNHQIIYLLFGPIIPIIAAIIVAFIEKRKQIRK